MNYTRNYKTEKSCKKCESAFVPSTNGPHPEFLAYEGYALVERKDDNVVSISDVVRDISNKVS